MSIPNSTHPNTHTQTYMYLYFSTSTGHVRYVQR